MQITLETKPFATLETDALVSYVFEEANPVQGRIAEVDQFTDSPGSGTDDPPAQVEVRQRLEHLERTLDQLPPRVAMALIMHRMAGHTIAEIARELGIAEITVKKYLARGLVHCRLTGPDPDSRASRAAEADVVTLKREAKP